MISTLCNIDITEEEGKILVKISAPHYDPLKIPRIIVETHHVVDHLDKNGYICGKCIQEYFLNNRKETEGTWIFEKKKLDKPAKKVILSKEEKPALKKNKSRAKKTTNK